MCDHYLTFFRLHGRLDQRTTLAAGWCEKCAVSQKTMVVVMLLTFSSREEDSGQRRTGGPNPTGKVSVKVDTAVSLLI